MTENEDPYASLDFAKFQRKPTPKVSPSKPLTIPHKDKPDKEDWFQIRPDVGYLAVFYVGKLGDNDERQIMVTPDVADCITDEGLKRNVIIREAYVASVGTLLVNENEVPEFVTDGYNATRAAAYRAAEKEYIRMTTDRVNSRYEFSRRVTPAESPVWSELDIVELVKKSFAASIIVDTNHPIIKNLRGIE